MGKGGSQSQTTTSVGARGRLAGAIPWGTAGLRRRQISGGGFAGSGHGSGSNVLRFYTADAPGLKMLLMMSLCFIGFVTTLYFFGKLYRQRAVGS